jgi:hypothetical protein
MFRYGVMLATTVTLLSCGSTPDSQVNCNESDWQELGKASALSGKPIRLFNRYIEQCGEGLPERAKPQFIVGYTAGLSQYCTYDFGYQQGLNNLPVNNICPLELRKNVEEGFKIGYFAYRDKIRAIEKIRNKNEMDKQQESLNKPVATDSATGN